ncbi:RNA 3'-terminal phosphate cyclase [Dyella sp.]|uniref:RNA 3'-terminal phosphate cyclase n=1 Tax=Dyella sp. TaxID=1869338 RepID=UPI002ED399FB
MIEIDGQAGGGQLLRTALSLSLCTGIGFTMENIRARRSRPGLMRQHLTAVRAAAEVGHARAGAAALGATRLRFEPGTVRAGDYRFNTGSAGSTTLVLQTVLPALWHAQTASRLSLEGGTHNPMAPSADFLADSYLPALLPMGIEASVTLQQHGFYPAGGGILHAHVQPATFKPASLLERGELVTMEAWAILSGLASQIGARELGVLGEELGLAEDALHLRSIKPPVGPGNALLVKVHHRKHAATFAAYGERGVSAEHVARKLARDVRAYLASPAYACDHLADQLLLPMALAGGGQFTTHTISDHLQSNARLIEKFLPVEILWEREADRVWRVVVE